MAGKEINNYMQLSKKAADLRERVSVLENRNSEVGDSFDNKDETALIEREARRRLNLKKSGEEVVIIIPGDEESIVRNALKIQEKGAHVTGGDESSWAFWTNWVSLEKWNEFLFDREK